VFIFTGDDKNELNMSGLLLNMFLSNSVASLFSLLPNLNEILLTFLDAFPSALPEFLRIFFNCPSCAPESPASLLTSLVP